MAEEPEVYLLPAPDMAAKKRYPQSRITKREIKMAYRRIFLVSLLIIAFILFLFFGGIPALLKISAFISNFGQGNEVITTPQTIPPLSPQLEPQPTATNSAEITVRGSAQAGTTVEVFLNDQSQGTVIAGNDGSFLLSKVFLGEGENKIWAFVLAADGTRSQTSNTLVINFKKTFPLLEVFEPAEGASYNKENKEIKVRGKTDPDTSVTINERWVIVDTTGNFSYTLPLLPGENLIKIVVTDRAGNQTMVERKVSYNP